MRVYVEAYGCSQNQGESRSLERGIVQGGHELHPTPEGADVGVLVTCAVIGTTERRMVRRWRRLAETVPRMVVTGCLVPLRAGLLDGPAAARTTLLPIREQARLPGLLGEWSQSTPAHRSGAEPRSSPPVVRPPVEEVVIAQGCTSHCTYCFSRLARGRLTSVPLERVRASVAAAIGRGSVEIRLSSLDTSCWGEDRTDGPRLPQLIRALTALSGVFRLRVGMMSPQSLEPIRREFFPTLRDPKVFRFLHLPVQSGSDLVLSRMRRGYPVESFRSLVDSARRLVPDLTLSTDVIVGFPGESDADFRSTVELLEECSPEIVNVTRYSPRPGTPSAREPPVPASVAKARSRSIAEHRQRLARRRMEAWVGREEEGLMVERGPSSTTVARLGNYLPVVVSEALPLGSFQSLRIDGARSTYLLGSLRGPAREPAPVPPVATVTPAVALLPML